MDTADTAPAPVDIAPRAAADTTASAAATGPGGGVVPTDASAVTARDVVATVNGFGRGPDSGVAAALETPSCPHPACADRWPESGPADRVEVTSPEAAAEVLVPLLVGADRERCVVALLDTKHRLRRTATVSIGSIDHTFMSPREVFRDALLGNAAALVLAHNHPSGDPEPSRDDEQVTRRLVRAGELVGVQVLDHLVVGGTRWVSLARRGVV